VPKILGYAETIVPRQSPEDFKSHFRLQRASVECLATLGSLHVTLIAPHLEVPNGRLAIDIGKQTLVFLWSLTNLECFRRLSSWDCFGLSKSTVCRVVHRFGMAVLAHGPNFVTWPTEQEAIHVIAGFEAKAGFPGVIGAIDGSHIDCKGIQGKNAESYVNQHGLHSVLFQAVCDHNARFLHCSAEDPGSVHGARMCRRSELPRILTPHKFPFDSHLLGDGADPLRQNLLVPYRNNGKLMSAAKLQHKAGNNASVNRTSLRHSERQISAPDIRRVPSSRAHCYSDRGCLHFAQ
ncbi:unnamed protein product, partial [Ixodes hexagonus]